MAKLHTAICEGVLGLKFAGVSLVGFATDALVLHAGVELGLQPAWARVISLVCALQVTFLINGLHVFRRLERKRIVRQWAAYMAANGFGNLCNYWIFVTLVSLHRPPVSDHLVALAIGSTSAWMINYVGTRFLVFGKARQTLEALRREARGETGQGASAARPAVRFRLARSRGPWPGRRRAP